MTAPTTLATADDHDPDFTAWTAELGVVDCDPDTVPTGPRREPDGIPPFKRAARGDEKRQAIAQSMGINRHRTSERPV